DYFPRIREICDKYDVLFVSDEVITGFGRTGKLFGLMHWNVQPDMILFATAITSGYFPLGGIGINERIADVLDTGEPLWMHAFTYSAHPVGCAVALRMLDIVHQENFPVQSAEKGSHLLESLRAALASHPHVGDVRGKGLMCGIEFVQDKATKAEYPATDQIGSKVHAAAQTRGLFSRLRGESVFSLAPPVVTPDPVLDRIVEIMAGAVRDVLGLSVRQRMATAFCHSWMTLVVPAGLHHDQQVSFGRSMACGRSAPRPIHRRRKL